MVLCVPSASREPEKISPAEEWRFAVESLKEICVEAEDRGILLAIEPINRFETRFINTIEDALKLIKDVASPNIKLVVDTFHTNIEEIYLLDKIKKAVGMICHCHANENNRGIAGTGHVPFRDIFSILKSNGYNGWMVVETFTPEIRALADRARIWRKLAPTQDELVKRSIAYLKNVWENAGANNV